METGVIGISAGLEFDSGVVSEPAEVVRLAMLPVFDHMMRYLSFGRSNVIAKTCKYSGYQP